MATEQLITTPVVRPSDGVTPLRRFVPAIMLSQFGFHVALSTPLQLLLTLHLKGIAGGEATTAFGIVTGFGAFVSLVFTPIAGRVSDRTRVRFGRRRPWIITGSLLAALALIGVTLTTQVWQVVLLWCGVQAVASFQDAANSALVADQVAERRRGRVSGIVGMAAATGPLVGLSLANAFPGGSAAQWWAIALFAIGASTVAAILLRDPRSSMPKPPLNLRTVASTFWFSPRTHPAFGWAWLVRFLIMCAFASSTYSTFFLMDRFDVSEQEIGGTVLKLAVLTIGCVAAASVVAGYLSDRLRRQKPFVVFAGVMAAAALVLFAGAQDMALIYVASGAIGVALGTFVAVDLALCVRLLPSKDDAGKDLGIINIANTLPGSFVPFAAPALLMLGGYEVLFVTLAALGVLGVVATSKLPEIGREHEPSRWIAPITRG
ncbi:MFS transporter [Streptomyces sp. NBC_00445]|uniref:MFS transporter n=1 Tax=Streptomyces sp. NBC_00445 TaxID=2975745 RepID=UPI002E2051A6